MNKVKDNLNISQTLILARNNLLNNLDDLSIKGVISYIRCKYYFSESYNKKDFENKIVNCVGANIILFECIKEIYPDRNFKYVSPTYQSLNDSGHLTKHICVAEVSKNKLRFIDATPLAGFFNGRISEWLNINDWLEDEGIYFHKDSMLFSDYEKKYTHSFCFLGNENVHNILKYIFLQKDKDASRFSIKNLPKAWYAELLKDEALHIDSEQEKINLLNKSYSISKNPFTYLKIDQNNYNSYVIKKFIKHNKKVIKDIDNYVKENNKKIPKKILQEYLATKYWKKIAINKIKGISSELPYIKYKEEKLYLYKIGRSYFDDKKNVLLVQGDSSKKTFEIVDEISVKKTSSSKILTGEDAYEELLLTLSPEVII
ncbi:hypothetical protein GW764_01695 [Candidatus Parcubacteria bacterium]|nr:hypothetical protein [Candidatus Parcubacteria bacterium]